MVESLSKITAIAPPPESAVLRVNVLFVSVESL
jgi:hypothetical protein